MPVGRISSYASVFSVLSELRRKARLEPRMERVPFSVSFGRVIAQNVIAPSDIPACDTSHMDGFAVRYRDIKGASQKAPVRLRVKEGVSLPGRKAKGKLSRGQAMAVATGSCLPEGTDTVFPSEDVSLQDGAITISSALSRGAFVYPAGADIAGGQRLLERGSVIRAQDVGMLAVAKVLSVAVYARPKVAVIPTGNEITDDIEAPRRNRAASRKVFNSNSHVIGNLVRVAGADPHYYGIAPDNPSDIMSKILKAMKACDIVLTIGGSSAGKSDSVESAIRSLGKPGIIAHGVRLDRGRVSGAAIIRSKPVIILPGPIQGATSAFFALALPLIDQMSGTRRRLMTVRAALATGWKARKKFANFTKVLYVSLSSSAGRMVATPLQAETESMMILVRSTGYVLVPESVFSLDAGKEVDVHLLPGFSF